ncbi:hypothetical protein VP1G_01062 [Cytospora mali]|uniref:Uncharacterized protein n=1 Tax=Cytospora mali TaxID=578113 RepID=A0A194UQD9_CYTMA|nr:hypothetical protein VP1G_01062 [Valsa mali var. pyri (nom. inval.)]
MSTTAQHQATINTNTSTFGGPDAELAARLAAPASPTETGTDHAAAEARRRTSDWKPQVQRSFSFDHEEHKRQMMAASGTLQKD